MNKDRVMEAVDIIFESRRSHVLRLESLKKYPRTEEEIALAGGEDHHRECIYNYDKVISVLMDVYDRMDDVPRGGRRFREVLSVG